MLLNDASKTFLKFHNKCLCIASKMAETLFKIFKKRLYKNNIQMNVSTMHGKKTKLNANFAIIQF